MFTVNKAVQSLSDQFEIGPESFVNGIFGFDIGRLLDGQKLTRLAGYPYRTILACRQNGPGRRQKDRALERLHGFSGGVERADRASRLFGARRTRKYVLITCAPLVTTVSSNDF